MSEHYIRIEIFVPAGDEFNELDDLVRASGWAHHVEYPYRVEGEKMVSVHGIALKPEPDGTA